MHQLEKGFFLYNGIRKLAKTTRLINTELRLTQVNMHYGQPGKPIQTFWRPRLHIKPATPSSADQRTTYRAAGASEHNSEPKMHAFIDAVPKQGVHNPDCGFLR